MDNHLQEYFENYLNKLEIGYRLPPEIKLEGFWQQLLLLRKAKAEVLPLKDQENRAFWYALPRSLQKKLHEIDSYGRDSLYTMVKKSIEGELLKESLIEEAFYSSVIEGAFSTLKKAKELVNEKRPPADKSEQMILNNYYAMRYILENKDKAISQELILELHKIVTDKTMDDQRFAGRYRDDWVYITDSQGKPIYKPPPAEQVQSLMRELIEWVNIDNEKNFIHPVVKAAILHFYLVYLHPFFDGNGRTARALFYFYLIKNRYEFFRYFSISSIINATRGQYYKSLKEVEDFDSDLTYFIVYIAESVLSAITEIKRRISEHYGREYYLARLKELNIPLNSRQAKFIAKFLLWKEKRITFTRYLDLFGVVYQTARTDLFDLEKKKVLKKEKTGKKFVFTLNQEL